MNIVASVAAAWDSIAYEALGDDLQMDVVLSANRRDYCDFVTFEGGEVVEIPENAVRETVIIEPPWS